MSKHNIQNRDHYTVAGRDRPGKAAAQVNPTVADKAEEEDRERWERQQNEKADESDEK